jgi:ribosomal protein S18 acetylase RimI-like enzyme
MSAEARPAAGSVDIATQSLARPAAVMAVGTVLSRLTGLGRVAAMAFALGVAESRLADSYNVANTLPNVLYELVLGGVLTSVFIPVLVGELRTRPHDEAWRSAYQGIIPGAELEKLINRRGPQWWDSAIRKGSRVSVLVFGDRIAGYANYGRNRARSLHFDGEIYELYLRPEFQGLGFGRRLFNAARRDLVQSGLKSMVIWALSDNEPATEFYRALGGRMVARSSEKFGPKSLDKVAFAWTN